MKKLISATVIMAVSTISASASTVLVGSSNGTIAEVDTSTGVVSNAFDAGNFNWFDIAVNNAGTAYVNDKGGTLYSVDLGLQSVTLVGGHGAFVNGLAFGGGNTLYGTGGGLLYTIDTSTGAASQVGSGVGSGFNSSGDIAFAGNNQLFGTSTGGCGGGTDCLYSIDAITGAGSLVGAIGVQNVYGLAVQGGVLFGLSSDDNIYKINTTTGAGSLATGYNVAGATNGAAVQPSTVPVPASLPLLLGGLAGLVFLRRRRKS